MRNTITKKRALSLCVGVNQVMKVCLDLARNSPNCMASGKENLDINQSLLKDRTCGLSYLMCCHTPQCNALSESELSELQEVNEVTQLYEINAVLFTAEKNRVEN